jgi:hypothetical protein
MHPTRWLCAFLVSAAFFSPVVAHAICLPTARTFYVGDTAANSHCDYDTIQAAIDAATCPETIVVTGASYTAQSLVITDKSLTIRGGGSACGPVVDPGSGQATDALPAQTILDGDGNGHRSVISISGNSHVVLANFEIRNGHADYTDHAYYSGGGINFVGGQGSLSLQNVSVHDNSAVFGGGVAVNPYDNTYHIDFELRDNVSIDHNTAGTDGAGIYVANDVYLRMVSPQSIVAYNTLTGLDGTGQPVNSYGGGIYLALAKADIGSPGIAPGYERSIRTPALYHNTAKYGGGLYAGASRVRLFGTDPLAPVALAQNVADYGAAVYASGFSDSPAQVCVLDGDFGTNQATAGAVVQLAAYAGLHFNSDPAGDCDFASLPALGAQACTPVLFNLCGTLINNFAATAMIDYADHSVLHADRMTLTGNASPEAVHADGGGSSSLSNCLVARNDFSGSPAAIELHQGGLVLDGCTFAGNTLDSNAVIFASDGPLSLLGSIFWQPGHHVLAYTGSALQAHYLDVNDATGLPSGPDVITTDPAFYAPQNGDYRLQPGSPVIDFAPASGSGDVDNRPRNVDMPWQSNHYGPRDLGAHEYQLPCAPDAVFCDGFEVIPQPVVIHI